VQAWSKCQLNDEVLFALLHWSSTWTWTRM